MRVLFDFFINIARWACLEVVFAVLFNSGNPAAVMQKFQNVLASLRSVR